eukprot:2229169-Alexandrium_andersonii.AAC.1
MAVQRSARNRLARHLLRLLRYGEVRGQFTLTCVEIRTWNNRTCDAISRDTQAVVRQEMKQRGFE